MLIKDNTYRVAKLFFDYPEREFHIRELARLTKLSPPGILKIIKKLSKEGLVLIDKGKLTKNVRASRTNIFLAKKRAYNMDSIFSVGLVDLLREKYEEPEAIVLFGSYSKGEDISKSDIDIAIITKKSINIYLEKFEKALNRKINIYEIIIKDSDKEFLNNLANGIVLYGYLKIL